MAGEGAMGWQSDADRWGQRDRDLPLLAGVRTVSRRQGWPVWAREAWSGFGRPRQARFPGQPRTPALTTRHAEHLDPNAWEFV